MVDKSKLTLDKEGLKNFINNQLVPLQDMLDKVANKTSEGGVTMDDLLDKGDYPDDEKEIFIVQPPLPIGQLAGKKSHSGGDKVVAAINDSAQSISDVYVKQLKLFKDLHNNLETTIKKLMDGQHDSLTKIDGEKFMDDLGLVSNDFQSSGGGSGGSGGS